jgi:RNA polymerase sigma-70 factor (ECF subfamily)
MTAAERFEAFLRKHQDMVYATAVRLLGNRTEAEDVAQTVFLKAYERFEQIGASPTAAGWLKTVATNVCLNHLSRYRTRWRLFSELDRDDAEGEKARYEDTLSSGESQASAVEQSDNLERLERALLQLPDHQRVPLVLFHFEDRTYQDIADLLGVSLGKLKTDIHRGREALKKTLTEVETDHGSDRD